MNRTYRLNCISLFIHNSPQSTQKVVLWDKSYKLPDGVTIKMEGGLSLRLSSGVSAK